jgi:hypothetical protein
MPRQRFLAGFAILMGALFGYTPVAADSIVPPPPQLELVGDRGDVATRGTVTIDVFQNDSGLDGQIEPRIDMAPSCGTLEVSARAITYTAADGCTGEVTFRYGVPLALSRSTAEVTVTIAPASEPPAVVDPSEPERAANDDTGATFAQLSLEIDILANDVIGPPPPPTLDITAQPACGEALLDSDRLIYTPAEGCTGPQVITYAFDTGETAQVTVTVQQPPARCPKLDGVTIIHVPESRLNLDALVDRGSTAAALITEWIGYTGRGGVITVPEFCIAVRHASPPMFTAKEAAEAPCRKRDMLDLATAYTRPEAEAAIAGLDVADWNVSLPGYQEIVAAMVHIESATEPDSRAEQNLFLGSLLHGAREWLTDSCGVDQALLIGGDCRRITRPSCVHIGQRQASFGFRLMFRRAP